MNSFIYVAIGFVSGALCVATMWTLSAMKRRYRDSIKTLEGIEAAEQIAATFGKIARGEK